MSHCETGPSLSVLAQLWPIAAESGGEVRGVFAQVLAVQAPAGSILATVHGWLGCDLEIMHIGALIDAVASRSADSVQAVEEILSAPACKGVDTILFVDHVEFGSGVVRPCALRDILGVMVDVLQLKGDRTLVVTARPTAALDWNSPLEQWQHSEIYWVPPMPGWGSEVVVDHGTAPVDAI